MSYATSAVTVECTEELSIGEIWNHCRLNGSFWRLYRNSCNGAGIRIGGRRRELFGGRFYLLAPDCDLLTWCDVPDVRQFYLHFDVAAYKPAAGVICTELPESPVLAALADRWIAVRQDSAVAELCATALAAAAFTLLPESARVPRENDPVLRRVAAEIRARMADDLDLTELSRLAGMAPNTLIRRFRDAYQCTPYRYLTAWRYSVAARMLEETAERSIDEICEAVGVRDRFHFSRMFKQFHGQSPGNYRRMRRAAILSATPDTANHSEIR